MIRWNQYVSVHETRAQETREKLLKAAIKLVNRDGMKQLTVRNICDEAGLSTGSFYNLFSGKEDLISYYLKYAFAPYREKALEGSDEYGPVERVLLLYRAYVEYCKDMGLEFVSGLYASNHNPFFDFMHRDAEDDFIIVSVRNYLAEAIELGIVRDDVDIAIKHFNKRADEYGGPIENRSRLLFEIYDSVRNAVGVDYPIALKQESRKHRCCQH